MLRYNIDITLGYYASDIVKWTDGSISTDRGALNQMDAEMGERYPDEESFVSAVIMKAREYGITLSPRDVQCETLSEIDEPEEEYDPYESSEVLHSTVSFSIFSRKQISKERLLEIIEFSVDHLWSDKSAEEITVDEITETDENSGSQDTIVSGEVLY